MKWVSGADSWGAPNQHYKMPFQGVWEVSSIMTGKMSGIVLGEDINPSLKVFWPPPLEDRMLSSELY